MDISPDIFKPGVIDRFPVREPVVGGSVVGVDLRPRFRVLHDERRHGFSLGVGHDLGPDLICSPVLDPSHGSHVHRTPPFQLGPDLLRFALPLSAHMHGVGFHRTREGIAVTHLPSLPDAVGHMPSRLLSDLQFPVKFHI